MDFRRALAEEIRLCDVILAVMLRVAKNWTLLSERLVRYNVKRGGFAWVNFNISIAQVDGSADHALYNRLTAV